MLYDWLKKFALHSQPIRCKTKTNCEIVTRIFPLLRPVSCIYFEFSLATFETFLCSVVITLVLLLQHSVAKRSINLDFQNMIYPSRSAHHVLNTTTTGKVVCMYMIKIISRI